jgi:hypothetical protein
MRIFYDVDPRERVRLVLARGGTVRRGGVGVVDYGDGLMELKGVYRREASMWLLSSNFRGLVGL